jgi:hypothetical protein
VATVVLVVSSAASVTSAPSVAVAQDDAASFRDLAIGTDFRVRVAAALSLGKSKSPGARAALEKALGDAHPAVRSAAAAALGALGDGRALPALRAAMASEGIADVKAEMDRSAKRLASTPAAGPQAPQAKARFLVAVGKVENKSGSTADKIGAALKASTRTRMAQVPGVEVLADGTDVGAEGKSRNLPAFAVDASITRLDKQQGADNIGYSAKVEYVLRRMPDQKLSGSMRGSAAAFADAKQVRGPDDLVDLQIEALAAAVDAALKGASPSLEAAVR